MRKLIFGINITLDGCCDHTKVDGNEDVHRYFTELTQTADTLLYGRKTYELMVPYWPDLARSHSSPDQPMDEFARAFTAVGEIVVFSRTLNRAPEKNTRIVNTDLREEVLRLKESKGKNILTGGVDLPLQLIRLGLIDEYHFVIHPLVAGEGRKLTEDGLLTERLQLKLTGTKVFTSGCVALQYVKG